MTVSETQMPARASAAVAAADSERNWPAALLPSLLDEGASTRPGNSTELGSAGSSCMPKLQVQPRTGSVRTSSWSAIMAQAHHHRPDWLASSDRLGSAELVAMRV